VENLKRIRLASVISNLQIAKNCRENTASARGELKRKLADMINVAERAAKEIWLDYRNIGGRLSFEQIMDLVNKGKGFDEAWQEDRHSSGCQFGVRPFDRRPFCRTTFGNTEDEPFGGDPLDCRAELDDELKREFGLSF
jgi:hypothetical protein